MIKTIVYVYCLNNWLISPEFYYEVSMITENGQDGGERQKHSIANLKISQIL